MSLTRDQVQELKIGVVTAKFNRPVTEKLQQGALQQLHELGLTDAQIVSVEVPGAFEIPLAVKQFLVEGFDAVVALGAVIRGSTPHFDYVCQSVERGCSTLQLEFNKPVAFGVITTENAAQAFARAGGAKGNKGAEAAAVAIEMIEVLSQIRNSIN